MKEIRIRLKTVEDVKQFVKTIEKSKQESYIKSGKYIVDAKSILCIFSLDLTNDMILEIENEEIVSEIKKFMIEEK